MTEPNMRIEISLSDETIEKVAVVLARVFLPLVQEPPQFTIVPDKPVRTFEASEPPGKVTVGDASPSIIDDVQEDVESSTTDVGWVAQSVAKLEDAKDQREQDTAEILAEINTGECGFIEGRESKKLRIDNKANTRMGETYWCQKEAGHKGKHTEGWPVEVPFVIPEIVEAVANSGTIKIDQSSDATGAVFAEPSTEPEEPEVSTETTISGKAKTNPEGRTRVIGPSEGARGGVLVARLAGYVNKDHDKDVCGWWLPAGASYGKFCAMSPNHSDSTMPGDHTWIPAPQMVRA